ncbi:hypothetical protein TELCIR_07210 [Teladorsagia circumcincta]|uniref:Ribosomal RNA-processing protein 8 n=1 Tax=Teladorsagia circumcincta TaxID=45464 RepID=A0A2G9UKW3_TELCI|nr:hypothetical protein TELCIR_07210 [Teladorsagia circumcincta]
MTGSEAWEYFQEDPDAFRCYHNGFAEQVHSFDLVAVNDYVTACDMAHLPMEDLSADIVVFCLSLMGTNLIDYIKETRRVLKLGGTLKIAEVVSRFVNVKLFCDALCKLGFELIEKASLSFRTLIYRER